MLITEFGYFHHFYAACCVCIFRPFHRSNSALVHCFSFCHSAEIQTIYTKLELKPVGKPDREVALLSWTKLFRMFTYQNDLLNILKNVCKESKLQIVEGSVVELFFFSGLSHCDQVPLHRGIKHYIDMMQNIRQKKKTKVWIMPIENWLRIHEAISFLSLFPVTCQQKHYILYMRCNL